jgi:hypothetical protein
MAQNSYCYCYYRLHLHLLLHTAYAFAFALAFTSENTTTERQTVCLFVDCRYALETKTKAKPVCLGHIGHIRGAL